MGNKAHTQQNTLIYPEFSPIVSEHWFQPEFWQDKITGRPSGGRGNSFFIKVNNMELVLRHYCRGGQMAKINKDKYLFLGSSRTRGFAEFKLHSYLFDLGLPVAKPVATRFVKSGLFYTGDYLCEKIPDSQTLAQYLIENKDFEILKKVKKTLDRFQKIGLNHVDLNAHNILLTKNQIYLLDFDKCNLNGTAKTNKKNLGRLLSSINKVLYKTV